MAIHLTLEAVMEQRGIGLTELSDRIGLRTVDLSTLNKEEAEALRFSTLNAICDVLDCQPGDILTFVRDEEPRL